MIIGELINSSRKAMRPLIEAWDSAAVAAVAKLQAAAGADYIDINCGSFTNDEPKRLAWLTETVRQSVELPLCLDTPNVEALKVALPLVGERQAMINSITAEKERFAAILPLVTAYNTKVIALCMSDEGIPVGVEGRIKVADQLINDLTGAGVAIDDIYIDPLVQPLATTNEGALPLLNSVSAIKNKYPQVHFVCGLSNISFGLPKRKLINRTFLVQAAFAGIDSFILDPTDKQLMGALFAGEALLGHDAFCGRYLAQYRKGLFDE